ncbi:hypothetical protein Patl1_08873 [Pistacia atlantica]|uniref:Uncharacterized protein n=1 Tax=Pistacia atlantica TaxID=434234 RepID=A0ACC1AHU0_9ROSI|nr:hypothetical protein Patl1_08873 [Pistacia atlantica]
MEVQWLNLAFVFFILFVSKFFLQKYANPKNLPPSPPALPFIGHLYMLKQPLHRTLYQLSEKYGHILFLQFGTRKVLVISSPYAVEECFTENDIIFANRPRTLAGKHLNYNYATIGFASYGDHWRNLRRLTTLELFSTSRLAMLSNIRLEEVQLMIKQLFQDSHNKEVKVELSSKLMEVSFNIMLRMIAGKRYYGKDIIDEEATQFREIMKGFVELSGSANLIDFLPVLKWVDFQGVEKRMIRLMGKLNKFAQFLVDEHRRKRKDTSPHLEGSSVGSISQDERKMTLIDVMLSLQDKEPELYTDVNIKGVILAMLIAGTETSSTTMEWAMSLLIKNPEAMRIAVSEIDANVGFDHLLNEQDLSKLDYLQNMINETLRLYPPVPLLLPHESTHDCRVCGYDIPKDTMLLVNLWTMQRDVKLWVDAEKFMPERFESGEGQGYKLIPFGAGRRACPGAVLGRGVVGLAVGALLQSFEWKRVGIEEMNMAEGTGLTMPRAHPLEALCKPRQKLIKLLKALVLLVSSPSAVEECFTKSDIIFANRPRLLAGKYLTYDYTTMVAAPYGHHWRTLRRLAALEFFSTSRLNMFLGIRQDEIMYLVKMLYQSCGQSFTEVEIKSKLFVLSFNIIMRMVSGKRYLGIEIDESEEAKRLREIVRDIFENLIDEHRNKRNCSAGERRTDTIIDSMLSLQESQPEYYSDEIIKGMIMTLLLAGTDTSAATKEWAISLLLNHPVVLKKARAELDNLVAAPLLVPHESSDFCTIGGYDVPPSTMLFVNAWAIHRDPNVWEDPTSFKPERFEGLEGVSEAYNFIPFGQGRRSCPGAGLANRVMGLTLATLIQCFEWERISEEEVDLTEGTGITMPKAKPLQAMFKARESMFNVL